MKTTTLSPAIIPAGVPTTMEAHGGLPRVPFRPNWQTGAPVEKRFLLLRVGGDLECIAATITHYLQYQASAPIQLGLMEDMTYVPGRQCGVRCIHELQPGHAVKVDIVFSRQGEDLFVGYKSDAHSLLRYLRFLVYTWLFLILWSLGFALLLAGTSAVPALAKEYSRRNFEDHVTAREAMPGGWRFDANTQEWVASGGDVTLVSMLERDPALVLSSLGIPAGILATVVGTVLAFAPAQLVHPPCRWLGWPTPESFNTSVSAHAAWIEGVCSTVLLEEFGIDETQRVVC